MEANAPRRSLRPISTGPSRSQTSTPHNVRDAALLGAVSAFARPKPVVGEQNGVSNANATPVNSKLLQTSLTGSTPISRTLSRTHTGSSVASVATNNTGEKRLERPGSLKRESSATSSSGLSRPGTPKLDRSQSFAAATIAAKRFPSTAPALKPSYTASVNGLVRGGGSEVESVQARRARGFLAARELDGSRDDDDEMGEDGRPDMKSIDSTRSLVKMFEQQSGSTTPAVSTPRPTTDKQPSLMAKGKPPPIVAPKPQRVVSGIQSISSELPKPETPKPAMAKKPLIPPPGKTMTPAKEEKPLIPAREPMKERQDQPTRESTPVVEKPNAPPPRRSARKPSVSSQVASPMTTQQAAKIPAVTPNPRSRAPSEPPQPYLNPGLPSNSRRASPAPYKDTSARMLTPHMTGDSLANAMVGANLAIKSPMRSPPKSFTPPPLPAPRRDKARSNHHHLDMLSRSRSLSPQKKATQKQPGRMLTTLRNHGEEEKRENKKHHFRQPNKHHEGTRERWRDEVGDSERKRYEGVWAANRGLLLPKGSDPDEVLDLVVRDVWSRSRLPPERLRGVWELVVADEEASSNGYGSGGSRRGSGEVRRQLTRDQFVVGMWLIDQQLKGRNLPHSVNGSVWDSVRLRGVKVRLEGKGKDGRKLERGEGW